MKRVIGFFCLFIDYSLCYSQVAYSSRQTDVFSICNNQAALAKQEKILIGISAENRFLLPSINRYTAVAAFPRRSDHFGIVLNCHAFDKYNECRIGLVYARKLDDKADAGVQFNYTSIAVGGYGNTSSVSVEAGLIFTVSEEFQTGIHITQAGKSPSVYKLGFGYDVSEQFFSGIEIVKEQSSPIYVNAGAYYSVAPSLIIKAGYSLSGWIGAIVSWRSMRVDITETFHPQLGPSSSFAFSYQIKRKEK